MFLKGVLLLRCFKMQGRSISILETGMFQVALILAPCLPVQGISIRTLETGMFQVALIFKFCRVGSAKCPSRVKYHHLLLHGIIICRLRCFKVSILSMSPLETDNSKRRSFKLVFSDAISFDQPIGNWDVSSGSDFSLMFVVAGRLNQDIGNWDVSSGSDFRFMFFNATNFNQNLSSWNLSDFAYVPFFL